MASTYLTRTTGTSTLNTKCTFSGWYKRGALTGAHQHIFSIGTSSGAQLRARFRTTDAFQVYGNITGQGEIQYITNKVFRDVNAWYHILISIDCTQSAANRVKIYVNGIEETSFDGTTQAEITSMDVLDSNTFQIGRRAESGADYFDGSISHFHFIDGTAYAASAFGETDSTTGEWKIKTSPSVTYGNNGFFILKDGNSVTDQSGNSNNFTVGGGTLTKTEDNPSNVFCTWNPLDNFYQESTFAHGNTQVRGKSPGIQYGYETFNTGTLGMTSGKYYWEIKFSANDSGATEIGIVDNVTTSSSQQLQQRTYGWSYSKDGTVKNNSSSVGGTWGTYTTGDIIGVALNLDDEQDGLNKLYFSKNGVWQNGSDPSNASSVTGVVGVTKPENNSSGFYFPAGGDENAGNSTLQANFGNGYFGTTAVSSAGTNASGIGIFEYDVPTGYTALSTKGLNL